MKGEETDSDLEDYYKELGIADEEDFSKKQSKEELYKKKPKVKKVKKADIDEDGTQVVVADKHKQKILDKIITSARDQPTHANLIRVIKIVK